MNKIKVTHLHDHLSERTRLFIENDEFPDEEEEREIARLFDREWSLCFNTCIYNAYRNIDEVFEAITQHDQIFASTAFVGDSGYLLQELIERAIKYNVTGKQIFILRKAKGLYLTGVDTEALRKVAQMNEFYFLTGNREYFELAFRS